jgi:hypothetical protein
VESVREVWSVGKRASLAWKDQIQVDPAFSSCEALDGLAATMGAECVDDDRRMTKLRRLRSVFVSTSCVP